MWFHSWVFLLVFLPGVLLSMAVVRRWLEPRSRVVWLLGASVLFYAWGSPLDAPLLVGSVLANYVVGLVLISGRLPRRWVLGTTIAVELALLVVLGATRQPLAWSFITFRQLLWLVDLSRDQADADDFFEYALFITWFPTLLLGPLQRHRSWQGLKVADARAGLQDLSQGVTLLAVGLFEKVVIADSCARWATPGFDLAAAGDIPNAVTAWGTALAWAVALTLGLMGYLDMARGAARVLGVRIDGDLHAPWRARTPADFWCRWQPSLLGAVRALVLDPVAVRVGRVGAAMLGVGLVWLWLGQLGGLLFASVQAVAVLGSRGLPSEGWRGWLSQAGTMVLMISSLTLLYPAELGTHGRLLAGLVAGGPTSTELPMLPLVATTLLGGAMMLAPSTDSWLSGWRPNVLLAVGVATLAIIGTLAIGQGRPTLLMAW